MLDFSILSDDQLVELVRAACQEAVRRGNGCSAAAQSAMLDEAEKARIIRTATENELAKIKEEEARRVAHEAAEKIRLQVQSQAQKTEEERQKRLWDKKKEISDWVREHVGENMELHLWTDSSKTEKRIYIGEIDRKRFSDNAISYFHTGNRKNPPRSIESRRGKDLRDRHPKETLVDYLSKIAEEWNTLRLNCTL